MAGAVGDGVGEVVEQHRHVEVDGGGHPLDRHGGIVGEVLRAEQALLFGRVGDDQDRAARPLGRGRERARHFEQRGDAGGIVERAVVDPIAGARRP